MFEQDSRFVRDIWSNWQMIQTARNLEDYRRQITRCARALASAQPDGIANDVAADESMTLVKMFTDGNCDKRLEKLLDQVELLQETFDDLEDVVSRYIREVPLAAYDTGSSDGDRFLGWLTRTAQPTTEQQDYIACQRSRFQVELIARRMRSAHVHFQKLRSMTEHRLDRFEDTLNVRLYLNPIRTWSVFHTQALTDDEAAVPADVLFYAFGDQIRTAVLEPPGLDAIRQLEPISPCSLDDWLEHAGQTGRDELRDIWLDAAQLGLVALID